MKKKNALWLCLICICLAAAACAKPAPAPQPPEATAAPERTPEPSPVPTATPAVCLSLAGKKGVDTAYLEALAASNPALREVDLEGSDFALRENASALEALGARTGLSFRFTVSAGGGEWESGTRSLAFTEPETPDEDLCALLRLNGTEELTLRYEAAPADIRTLQTQCPGMTVRFTLTLAGQPVSEETESLSYNGVKLGGLEEFYEVLPVLTKLTSLEMCGCGISNGEMDALREAFPAAGIVWAIETPHWTVRTDATHFATWRIAKRNDEGLITEAYNIHFNTNADLDWLAYCHDMVALDVGHNLLENCEFVRNMPHLEFLIIADNKIKDLSPLEDLHELTYLEIFANPITDITPLEKVTSLRDLNACGCRIDDLTPLMGLPLERLWLAVYGFNKKSASAVTGEFAAAHPDCEIGIVGDRDFTGLGWRKCDRYWEMRQALGWADLRVKK